jgi:hypothetical protein
VGAVIGGAAVGVAGHLVNRRSRPKVLGIPIPNELNPKRLDVSKLTKGLDANELASHIDVKKLGKHIDLKDLARQIGDIAERVEVHSEDVRALSGQAKRLSRRIS